MTVEEIKALLNMTYFCYRRINQLQERIDRWRSKAERMTPTYSLVPGGGGSDHGHVEADVLMMVEMESNLEDEIKKYKAVLNRNTEIIERVPDPYQRTILSEHFVYGETFANIAEGLRYDERQVYRIYNAGLQWLSENLKDVSECQYTTML